MIFETLKDTDIPDDIQAFWQKRYGDGIFLNFTEMGTIIYKDHPRTGDNMLAAGYPIGADGVSHVTVYFIGNQSYNKEKMQKVIKLIAFL